MYFVRYTDTVTGKFVATIATTEEIRLLESTTNVINIRVYTLDTQQKLSLNECYSRGIN